MPWSDLFPVRREPESSPVRSSTDIGDGLVPTAIFQGQGLGSVVVVLLPDEVMEYHLEMLRQGVGRLNLICPNTVFRIYLKEPSRGCLPELLKIGFEVLLFPESEFPSELLSLLALGDERKGETTFTRIDRFWFAADDVARTRLLADSPLASWRVLDSWSRSHEEYWALHDCGWGTRLHLDVKSCLAAFLACQRPAEDQGRRRLVRDFITEELYPRLVPGGFLSIFNEVSPPARHWVALDIENVTKVSPDSGIHFLPALKGGPDLQDVPTMIFKGYEIPVAGVTSSHQRLSIFSPELEKLHAIMRQTLRDFHSFAEEMDIRYSLWAGSLLGLFTCGDFLPWDDDMDILIHPDDFERLEKFWWSCSPSPSGHIPYHRSYVKDLTRLARFGGNEYEFLSSGPGQSRILYKLRPVDSEGIFAYNIGGLDLTSIYSDNGGWLERWKLHQPVPSAAALENDVEDVLFGGVATRAYRRDLIEPYLLEKYHPLEWWKHPLLGKKPDLPEDGI